MKSTITNAPGLSRPRRTGGGPVTVPVVAVATILLAGCFWGGGDPEPPPTPISTAPPRVVITLDRHYYDNAGGIQDSLQVILRDRAHFEEYWIRATSRQPSPPPAPDIDFGSRMVVLVGTGPMDPGAEVRVDSAGVQRRNTADVGEQEVLVVFVSVTEGCAGFDARSYPLEIVSLPLFDPPVEFRTSILPAACQQEGTGGSWAVPQPPGPAHTLGPATER